MGLIFGITGDHLVGLLVLRDRSLIMALEGFVRVHIVNCWGADMLGQMYKQYSVIPPVESAWKSAITPLNRFPLVIINDTPLMFRDIQIGLDRLVNQ